MIKTGRPRWVRHNPVVAEEDEAEMKKLREEGWTYAKIAEKFGVSLNTVQYHTNDRTREKTRERAKRWCRENPERHKENNKRFFRGHQYRYMRRTLVQKGKIKTVIKARGKDAGIG